jgi:DNA modification methylase
MNSLLRNRVLTGDASRWLRQLPEAFVDCVVCSPPYIGLRDYGHPGQIGAEPTVEEWVKHLRMVMSQVARVLKPTGTCWLNLGDAYARHDRHGVSTKSRLLAPERLALALLADGWTVRNVIVWHKPNPTPSSVRDRLTCAWEPMYLLTRSRKYFFDLDAIRIPHTSQRAPSRQAVEQRRRPAWAGPLAGDQSGLDKLHTEGLPGHPLGKNPGDVWTVSTSGYRSGHHAAFPEALVERPLLAGCPERVCTTCGQPWEREPVQRRLGHLAVLGSLQPTCLCGRRWQPGLVLDPFMGSGTTAMVAGRLRRDWLGVELNPDFVTLSLRRLSRKRAERPAIRSPAGGGLGPTQTA